MLHPTFFFILKAALSGLIIAAITTLAKHSPKGAALLTALPLVTFLSLIWIYVEKRDLNFLADYSWDVLVWTLPSLFFFLAIILLFRAKVPFALSMALSTAALGIGVWVFEKFRWIK
ncbi:MAG: DUF3147 family protein [bacterium]